METTGTGEDGNPPGGLFSGYVPPADAIDEVLTRDGRVRAPWARFVGGLEQLGPQTLGQRADQARMLLRENGVTYNVFGAPQGPDRPWELDPIPLLVPRDQWQELSEGVAQRVLLLNKIVADVYGPQDLLKRGLLPPKLVFGHPGFLHPCRYLAVPRQTYLHLYAGHLARGMDGEWVVLADRTQGPSGAGFAVENRIVISRILPQDFQALYVERLASFFITLRDTLQGLATRPGDNPRVVLFSPGPRSATYFEDGYLARYLGYSLVEGGDLTVRGHGVFLKTLGGLLPVDVILRRVADEDCDPLEMRGDANLGVPGLLQAARSGQVVIANALGSGFLEAPALMAFLPEICQALLGEPLKLRSVPTWWCGREDHFEYVRSHMQELLIRPAFQHRSAQPVAGWQLSERARAELLDRIRARPGLYVAQARVLRSTAPVWSNGTIRPWRVGVRVFAAANGSGYSVMPGGLSRVSSAHDFGESIGAGQGSKDVWVLSDAPVKADTLLRPPRAAVELRRSVNDVPSRAADNLFWLGRHVERAEGMVRHLRSAVVRMTNELEPAGLPELTALVAALSEPGEAPWKRAAAVLSPDAAKGSAVGGSADSSSSAATQPNGAVPLGPTLEELRAEARDFLFNTRRPIGLCATLESLHRTAAVVRDRLSIDGWRIVNQMNLQQLFPWPSAQARLADVLLLLNQLLNLLSAFSGLGMESMTRGPGWRFLDMGRRCERALHTMQLIERTLVHAPGELTPLLEVILEVADSTMTYRYRYLSSLQLAPVLDLILVDETNPRAVGFQLSALADHVRSLPRDPQSASLPTEHRIVLAAQAELRLCDVDAFCETDSSGQRRPLAEFLERVAEHVRRLSDSITRTYLTHTGVSRRLESLADEK